MSAITISQSQIKTARLCFRKWGFQKIDGIVEEAGRGALLGGEVHSGAERHFTGRPMDNLSGHPLKIAQALVASYGNVPEKREVELEFWIPMDKGDWEYHGFIDLLFERDGVLWINDHKTSRDPQRWGLKPETFMDDEQVLIYSFAGYQGHTKTARISELFDYGPVIANWAYVNTQGRPKPFHIAAGMPEDLVCERMEPIHVDARRLVDARRNTKKAVELPYDTTHKACAAFGGCPHAAYCPREAPSLVDLFLTKPTNGEKQMGLMDKFKARQAAAAAEAPTEAPAEKAERKAPDGKKPATNRPSLSERMRRGKKGAKTEPRQVNAPEVDTSDTEERNDDNIVQMSQNIGKGDNEEEAAAEVAATNAGQTPALEADQVMAELLDAGGEMTFSVSRKNEQFPYVKKTTLKALESAGKIEWYVDGQKAHVSIPTTKPEHASAWIQFVGIVVNGDFEGDAFEIADGMLDEYKKRFG